MIDRSALDRLQETIGGDPVDLIEMINTFLEEGPTLLQHLVHALERDDEVLLRRGAHSLKSNARDFGAGIMADQAQEIEDALRAGQKPDNLAARVAAIVDEWDRVEAELRAFVSQLGQR